MFIWSQQRHYTRQGGRTKLLVRAGSVFDAVIGSLAVLAASLIVCDMLLVVADVVGRQFLRHPIVWVPEICEITLVGATFLGAAWLLRRDGHVKMDLLLTRLNPRTQSLLNTITSILCAIICLVLGWYGAKLTWDHFERGVVITGLLMWPAFPRYAIISAGSFLLSIQFARTTYGYLGKRRTGS